MSKIGMGLRSLFEQSIWGTYIGRWILTYALVKFREKTEFPSHLDIELTNVCNLDCVMCPRGKMTRERGFMELDLFKQIIDEAAVHRLNSVWLHLFGEPLLHPLVTEMTRYAKVKGNVRNVGLSTNCTRLDETMTKKLVESGLDAIMLSVDGATRETYEKIRRRANYEKVIANVRNFLEYRKKIGAERPAVSLSIIRMDETAGEIELFRDSWRDLLGPRDEILVKKFVAFGGQVEQLDSNMSGSRRRLPCTRLWKSLSIYQSGDVTACCLDSDKFLLLGSVSDSLQGIWKGEQLRKYRQIHLRGEFSKMPLCAQCELIKV